MPMWFSRNGLQFGARQRHRSYRCGLVLDRLDGEAGTGFRWDPGGLGTDRVATFGEQLIHAACRQVDIGGSETVFGEVVAEDDVG
jgi:hypothetical protein